MANRLDKDPPTDNSKEQWLEDDARLFLQLRNSINGSPCFLDANWAGSKEDRRSTS